MGVCPSIVVRRHGLSQGLGGMPDLISYSTIVLYCWLLASDAMEPRLGAYLSCHIIPDHLYGLHPFRSIFSVKGVDIFKSHLANVLDEILASTGRCGKTASARERHDRHFVCAVAGWAYRIDTR
jgi:hypothetical protein